jgi:hypothetical protein
MRPAISRSSVDLPQPDGPTMETNSPGVASKLTWSTARTPPSNCLTASSTEIVPRSPGEAAPSCCSASSIPSSTGRARSCALQSIALQSFAIVLRVRRERQAASLLSLIEPARGTSGDT